MKNSLLILIGFLFLGRLYAQCPPGNITLSTQEQIDNFIINYPNCTQLAGNLSIGSSYPANTNITSLLPLSNLTSVQGLLKIEGNPNLVSLSGLHNITTVNSLFIGYHYSNQLTSLSGLQGLITVNGNLNITLNNGLTTLIGLDNVQTIGGFLSIIELPALTSISTLNNLTYVGDYISINTIPLMTSLSAFQNLASCSALKIQTTGLTSITGLSNLQNVWSLNIINNSNLIDISSLNNINPNNILLLNIYSNPLLTFCNLPNFCTFLTHSTSTLGSINNNAGNCLNKATVIVACQNLDTETPVIAKDFIVYSSNKVLNIISDNFEMKNVEIFDSLGRIVYSNAANKNHQQIYNLTENQLLFIKVTTADGKLYFKKIIN